MNNNNDDNNDVCKKTFPFVSPCGNELNFIHCADEKTPIVLNDFDETNGKFFFGTVRGAVNPLSVDFESDKLSFDEQNGKMYFSLRDNEKFAAKGIECALVRSQLALELIEKQLFTFS